MLKYMQSFLGSGNQVVKINIRFSFGFFLRIDSVPGISSVRPGTVGLPTGTEHFRVGSGTWIRPTSFVSTRIGVELVDLLGN